MTTAVQLKATARRLTSQDASFIYGESFHGPMHIGSLVLLDGPLTRAQLADHVERRLHLVPRYRQRLAQVPFNLNHAVWEDDPNFSIDRHVFGQRLPANCGEAEMRAIAMEKHEEVLKRDRPLWEMHVFEGMEDDKSALLWKIHHCLVDGVSGIELSTVMLDFEREALPPDPPDEPWEPATPATPAQAVTDAVFDLMQSQLEMARRAQHEFRDPEASRTRMEMLGRAGQSMVRIASEPVIMAPWNIPPITFRRSLEWLKWEFGEVRGIKGVLGGTVNDVVLAVLAEGAARYLRDKWTVAPGQKMRIGCPVNVRKGDESGALGNRVSMMFPSLSAEPMAAVERLNAVRVETERIKDAQEAQGLELLTENADLVPPSMTAGLAAGMLAQSDASATMSAFFPRPSMAAPVFPTYGTGITFVATNVPGVGVPQYVAGRKVTDNIGLMLLGGNLGYGVAIGTYNQVLYIGMMGEPRVMPDLALMKQHVSDAYDELRAAAMAASPAR